MNIIIALAKTNQNSKREYNSVRIFVCRYLYIYKDIYVFFLIVYLLDFSTDYHGFL